MSNQITINNSLSTTVTGTVSVFGIEQSISLPSNGTTTLSSIPSGIPFSVSISTGDGVLSGVTFNDTTPSGSVTYTLSVSGCTNSLIPSNTSNYTLCSSSNQSMNLNNLFGFSNASDTSGWAILIVIIAVILAIIIDVFT